MWNLKLKTFSEQLLMHTCSLSKCLKYPGFIFLCPQKLSKKNPRKKTKSLNYPNTIPEFFSEFGYVQDFFYVPRTIRGKKTNTLNYPNSIRYFGDLAKFSRILHENIKFLHLCFFVKIWQCLTLWSSQSNRLTVARCKIKWLCWDKFFVHEVSEKIWLSPRSIQKESDSSGT